jgi:hypothetical protein
VLATISGETAAACADTIQASMASMHTIVVRQVLQYSTALAPQFWPA